MPTISFTITAAAATRINDAFATRFNYAANGGGKTKSEFTRAIVSEYIKNIVKSAEGETAASAALTTAQADVDAQVIIT